ncbi:Arabinogalactan peptide 12, partial [Capsicum annuum]
HFAVKEGISVSHLTTFIIQMGAINMNMKIIVVALVITMVAISAMNGVSAADAPAPAPASDATTVFVPAAVFTSFVALAFALLF